jgi:hypothetical protein
VTALPNDSNGNFVEPTRAVPVYGQDGTTRIGTFTIDEAGTSTP